MRNRTRATTSVAVLALAAFALAFFGSGCSPDDAGTIPASGTEGAADCDPGAFGNALGAALQESLMTVESVDDFECADGWAVVQATVAGEEGPSVQEQYVLAATDSGWVLASPETSCGTIVQDGVRPDDASVPASIWEQACGML
ncbi:MAG: hypothetical protein KGP12_02290 [Actinomycetales bacterium]|nr:hypothetical protein [Actinomycetales bacterium]